jgi:hypothetical protein
MNSFEIKGCSFPANPSQPAAAFAARAWRPSEACRAAAPGDRSESPRYDEEPLRRTTFSEQFRSASEFPRYLTQGMGEGSA